jgi:hypothetical protein
MIRRRIFAAALLSAAALAPLAQVHAAGCNAAGASALTVGTVVDVAPGSAANYALNLGAGEGVIIDLASLAAQDAASDGDEGEKPAAPRSLAVCNAKGAVLAPQPGEVFEKGGSVSAIEGGQRLRFIAPTAGRYTLSVTPADARRELLVRKRELTGGQAAALPAQLDGTQSGVASTAAPMVYSFAGTAGTWVELKSTSEKDTVLRLAGPDREGNYSVVAENDDSDGLNPVIRRKLATTGTYYLQVDSLSDEAGEFALTLKRIEAPKPPPPPAVLRAGAALSAKLDSGDDVKIYALPVVAGHSYRIEAAAPAYDIALAIGLPNPVEPDDGGTAPDASFSEVKSQDSGTRGTEKLNFTARSTGQLLVRVKSFGLEESDGSFMLGVTDLGG